MTPEQAVQEAARTSGDTILETFIGNGGNLQGLDVIQAQAYQVMSDALHYNQRSRGSRFDFEMKKDTRLSDMLSSAIEEASRYR